MSFRVRKRRCGNDSPHRSCRCPSLAKESTGTDHRPERQALRIPGEMTRSRSAASRVCQAVRCEAHGNRLSPRGFAAAYLVAGEAVAVTASALFGGAVRAQSFGRPGMRGADRAVQGSRAQGLAELEARNTLRTNGISCGNSFRPAALCGGWRWWQRTRPTVSNGQSQP
ncbi:predicted protein [Streptomyces sp. AA4]|nr:predicted protein [Streptomyces sp. AA4]